ncbi:hypothetical protein CTI12_AA363060 [Artemisia annua]|uniref:RRM domain-containing protein n=1 Tax=Artemisia annua TaxID=35608 RepID=A0A2U1MMT2_ARTAN|nr:hypothetical protein CTI12_AA363060 [Artemisia annua]
MAGNNNSHGWTWVFGNNKKQHSKPIDNPFVKDVEKIATSYFVTNFPETLDAKNLWKEFQSHGRIVDAYIANKRSKIGKRFGFVRFLGVRNRDEFAKTLSNIWIGSYHLNEGFANVNIHYVGGLWVWIQFDNPKACEAFKANESLKNFWSSIRTVSPSFIIDERLIWIEINGLPLCAWGSNALKKVTIVIHGKIFNVHVKEVGSWSTSITNDFECSEAEDKIGEEESHSSNEEENSIEALDDFIEHEAEQKPKSCFTKEVNHEEKDSESDASGDKPPGFETVIKEEDLPPMIPKKEDPIVNSKEEELKEGDSDASVPPGFENIFKGGNSRSNSSSRSKGNKCSTSFGKYKFKDRKGFSFIDEMNRMIEVGDALGYDVKGCKRSLRKMINEIGVSLVDK